MESDLDRLIRHCGTNDRGEWLVTIGRHIPHYGTDPAYWWVRFPVRMVGRNRRWDSATSPLSLESAARLAWDMQPLRGTA